MAIELISNITQKNGGNFPLVLAKDVEIGDNAQRLDKSISTLETSVSANTESISTLETSVAGNAKSISTLETSVAGNAKSISTLQTSVAGLQDVVAAIAELTETEINTICES